jgi:hypothetical protein
MSRTHDIRAPVSACFDGEVRWVDAGDAASASGGGALALRFLDQRLQFLHRGYGSSPLMGHGVTVGAQRHQIRLRIHLPLVLRERLDVVDLDIAISVVLAVGLVEVKLAHGTGGSV